MQRSPTETDSPPPGKRFLPELECLRGVAISLVFIYHVAGFIDGTRGHRLGLWVSPWRAFVHGGQTGVSLFFVLSAFLLALPFWDEVYGGRKIDSRRYYERRALRILPLYWSVVLATAILLASQPSDLLKAGPYLVFLNSLPRFNAPLAPLNGVWWSLATEVQFYLVLPLLPVLLRRQRLGLAVGLLFGGAYGSLIIPSILPIGMAAELSLRHSLIGRAPLFAAGLATAWLYLRHGERFRHYAAGGWLSRGGGDLLLLALVLALGMILRQVVHMGYWEMELTRHAWHVGEAVLWSSIVWVVLVVPLRVRRLFVNPFLEAIGRWSYSIYLLHVPLLYLCLRLLPFQSPQEFVGWRWVDFGIVALLGSVTVAVSALSYHYIERPFLVRKAQLQR